MKMELFSLLFTFQSLIIICFVDKSRQSGRTTFARVVLNKPDRQLLPEKNLVANLKNESFIASSVWKEIVEFEPHQARMKQMDDPNLLGHAWCPKQMIKSSPEEWIEIDLGDLKMIKNLATAGRGDGNFAEYAPHFYLDYQRVSGKWIRYKNQRKEQLLNGNTDARNVAMTNFESMIIARRIRIYPISKEKQIRACMRIIIYGCDFDDGVVEYSVSQGHYYTARNGNEKYDLRDLTYDGVISIDKSNTKGLLEEGLGQLMDNVIYNGVISEDHNNKIRGYHFVGWNRKFLDSNKVEIVMKFDQMRSVKQIRFYAMNMIPEDIGVFSSAIIHFSRGGVYYDRISPAYQFKTVIDTRVYYPRWINITLQNVLARFLKIDLFFEVDWIILSEIVIISEKSNEIIPKESESIQTNSPITHNITSVKYIPTDSTATVLIPQNGKNNHLDTNRSSSFTASSSLGLIATISSCFLGFVFLIALIVFGVFTLRRHKKRTKGKLRNPIYQTRINGGPFIGDSVVVPLTGGTQSSSGTGSFYYKYPGNVELGLTYPVMGKEYMTLSSKSGTDYDMAGGNSLDGLIPTGTRDIKYNGMNSYAPPMGQNDSPYPTNIYSRNSADGSTGGSSNTDYASTSLYHFSQVFENGSNFYPYNQQNVGMNSFALHKMNPSVMSSLSGSPFKVQSPTPSTQILPPNQLMDMFSHYSPYRQISHLSQFSPTHSTSSRFLMPSNADLYPTSYVVPVNNFQTDQSVIMTNSMPSLQGISGNSVMVATNDAFQQPPSNSVTLKKLLSNLKEFHQEQIGHVSVIGKGENGTVGYISIAQNISTEPSKTTVISKSFLYRSLNNYNSKDVKYETMKELELLCGIKHSVFLPLTAYVLDEQNSMSVHQTALCFLFEFDEPLENLHTFLNQHAVNKAAILNLPRGPTLYSQSISNISANSSFNTRHLYPSVSSLLFIITQIARGMSYLESRQIIHRDLAARNCLIGQNLKIKITDIAMSIQKFKEHYIECAVVGIQKNEDCDSNSSISVVKRFYPLQWMAFESILQATYSCKTDIWSFGVTMWEILHRCQQTPYGGFAISFDRIRDNAYNLSIGNSSAVFPNENLYPHQSQSNFRPSQHMANPSSSILHENLGLSRDFSDLIQECWNRNPHQRPTFKLISSILEQKITNFEFANDHSNLFSTINNSETY